MTITSCRRPLIAALLILCPGFFCAANGVEPVGRWSFETEGQQVVDESGHGLDGTAPGCARAPGRRGLALQLDGTCGVLIGDSPLLRGKRGFTVECWIRSSAPPGPAMNLISKGREFMLRVDPAAAGGTISFFVWCSGQGWEPRARGPRLDPDKWYHLVASWDGKTARLLVNRTVYESPKRGVCPRTSAPLRLGGPAEGLSGFVGRLDEAQVFNVPFGPLALQRIGYGLAQRWTGPRRSRLECDFRNGWQGWRTVGDLDVTPRKGGLHAVFHESDALLLARGLRVTGAEHPLCNVRVATTDARRAVCVFVGRRAIKEIPFRLRRDGQPHTYTVRWAANFADEALEAVGFHVEGANPPTVILESFSLDAEAKAPPDVYPVSLAPARRIGAVGRPLSVRGWVRNEGGAAKQVEVDWSASPGIRVSGIGSATLSLSYQQQAEVTATLVGDRPVSGEVRLRVRCNGEPCGQLIRPVSFARDPKAAAVTLFRSRAWLHAGYPKSMDFRHLWPESIEFLEHNTAFLVDFGRRPDGSRKSAAAQELKERYPDRLVLMQVNDETNGIWGSWHVAPREFAAKEGLQCDPMVFPQPTFRGYWLLGPRAPLTSDFRADQETVQLSVPDVNLFRVTVWGRPALRDVLLYPSVHGRPDWAAAEYASVVAVDEQASAITVRRWPRDAGGGRRAFRAGEAWVAPSVGSIYRAPATGKWIKTWIPNLTRFCPRDPATGMNAVDWWAKHFAALWRRRVAVGEPHPDGFEFDGLTESPVSDCDNDGVVDGCLKGGINYWRLGLDDFFRTLRRQAPGALILADASDVWAVQDPTILNGSENEEFPSFGGPSRLPTGMDLYRVWVGLSAKPSCCYLQGRFDCDTYREGGWRKARQAGRFHPDGLVRLSIAAACMGDGIYSYRTGGKRDRTVIAAGKELLEYPWDEYHAGVEGCYHWLGQPLAPAARLNARTGPDLAAQTRGAEGWRLEQSGTQVRAAGPRRTKLGTRPAVEVEILSIDTTGAPRPSPLALARQAALLSPETTAPLKAGDEYCVEFLAWADPQYDEREGEVYRGVQRVVSVCLRCGRREGEVQSFLVGDRNRSVALTLTAPASGPARVAFLCGADLGPVRLADLHLYKGCAEVFARRFEHGLALMNGSLVSPFTFDVAALGGGASYRRFRGRQCPDVNTGKPVGATVTLPPQDGLLLKKTTATDEPPRRPGRTNQ